MKKKYLLLFVLFVSALLPYQLFAQNTAQLSTQSAAQLPAQNADVFKQEGIASWYGREFEGRPTASGEIFDSAKLTAAHPTLPFGTNLIVTNIHNNKSVIVRVNDRGPFVPARIIDVSRAAAEQLDMIVTGTAPVTIMSTEKVIISTPAVGVQVLPYVTADPSITLVSEIPMNIKSIENSIIDISAVVYKPQSQTPDAKINLIPDIAIVNDNNYRLQIGSFKIARNAVEAFERLKTAGLSPAYERFVSGDNTVYYRVVLAGIQGINLHAIADKIFAAGFKEAMIREEN